MKKFKFRFQTVLTQRKIIEDQKKTELAKALAVKENIVQEKIKMKSELNKAREKLSFTGPSAITSDQIELNRHYAISLESALKEKDIEIEESEKEIEICQKTLHEAMKEKKIFEKLKEKQHRQYIYESEKEEAQITDEIVVQRYKSGQI